MSDKRRIILLRHAQSTANSMLLLTGRNDPELTRLGFRQAKEASRIIKKRFPLIDSLYASPMKRSLATAGIIAKKVRAPVIQDELLMETDFGDWEGSNREELVQKPEWNEYIQDPFHFRFPGGESPQDVKKRILQFRQKMLARTEWENIVVISHYTPIVFYILSVLNSDDEKRAAFKIGNAAVTSVVASENGSYLEFLNLTRL